MSIEIVPSGGLKRPHDSAGAARIMIVDDDLGMQRVISEYLEASGLKTSVSAGRSEMTSLLDQLPHSLVILDLHLGREDGLDLLRELRAKSDLPVIITTGHRRDEIDRIIGLELGADDYIIKPFSLRELLARIRVVLRRAESTVSPPPRDPTIGRCRFCGWTLDRRQRRLANPDGEQVELTKGEYALLLAFINAPQRPLSREFLLQATRVHEDIYDRSIDVQILRLRRKLEVDASIPQMIKTERGVGYVFTPEVATIT